MALYTARIENGILLVGFGDPASNDQVILEAKNVVGNLLASGELQTLGKVLKINGVQSIPVAYVLALLLNPHFPVISIFDPKIENGKFVVVKSLDPDFTLGQLLD